MRALAKLLLSMAVVALLAGCGAGEPRDGDSPAVQAMWTLSTTSEEAARHLRTAQGLSDMNHRFVAYERAKQAIAADPLNAFSYYLAAQTAPSYEDFRGNLRRAIDNAASASTTERMLIDAQERMFNGDAEGASALAQELADTDPTNPRVWLELAGWQMARDDVPAARTALERALELDPDFVPAHMRLGNSYTVEDPEDYARAERHLMRAVELRPEEYYPYDLLGDLRRAEGRLAEAREAYTRSSELAPEYALPWGQRGHVNALLGDYEAARADYARAGELGRGNEVASYARYAALTRIFQGDLDGALAELEDVYRRLDQMDVASLEGQQGQTLYWLFMVALAAGDTAAARANLEVAEPLMLAQAEETGTEAARNGALANVAWSEGLLALEGGDHAVARAKAEEVRRLGAVFNSPYWTYWVHELLGQVALAEGRYSEAVLEFEQSYQSDPYVQFHHALALEGAGRTQEAIDLYRKVAEYRFIGVTMAIVKPKAEARLAGLEAAQPGG